MRSLGILVMAGVLVVAPRGISAAASPEDVLIQVEVMASPDGFSVGRFTARGPVCRSGHTSDIFARVAGSQSDRRVQILVAREFTCDDESGTFLLLVRVHGQFDEPGSDVFVHPIPKSWSVLDGTGAFEGLHGAGDGVGVTTEQGFSDTLTGKMQIAPQGVGRLRT